MVRAAQRLQFQLHDAVAPAMTMASLHQQMKGACMVRAAQRLQFQLHDAVAPAMTMASLHQQMKGASAQSCTQTIRSTVTFVLHASCPLMLSQEKDSFSCDLVDLACEASATQNMHSAWCLQVTDFRKCMPDCCGASSSCNAGPDKQSCALMFSGCKPLLSGAYSPCSCRLAAWFSAVRAVHARRTVVLCEGGQFEHGS
jgi:hypothetical protein